MAKRIAAILFIFVCTWFAWAALGATIFARTYSADATLKGQVESVWGAPHQQLPPTASYQWIEKKKEESIRDGKANVSITEVTHTEPLLLEASAVQAALNLEHRQKGLLWYSTYRVVFGGEYSFRNTSRQPQTVSFDLTFPANLAVYDRLTLTLDGAPAPYTTFSTGVQVRALVAGGATARFRVGYASQGLDRWSYKFGPNEVNTARNFDLRMTTSFPEIDFPDGSLSATEKRATGGGWELHWAYQNLVSGAQIIMPMPEKLQPGPLAGQISLFAPVSLFFFFFLMFIITTLREINLHPMHYFFLACAFFAFHLLLAYLVDHISIHSAFLVCSAVSIFLVVSYLRTVIGPRFAFVEAGLAQFIYLVLFSYAFFFKGFTGLAITIGAIVTLFVVMQMTARVQWDAVFAKAATAAR